MRHRYRDVAVAAACREGGLDQRQVEPPAESEIDWGARNAEDLEDLRRARGVADRVPAPSSVPQLRRRRVTRSEKRRSR